MSETDDIARREATPPSLSRVRSGDDRRAPWWVYALTEFITKTGFPVLMALLLMGYVWFVGLKTNDLMTRAVVVLERFEVKK